MSFETNLSRLEEIVDQLDSSNISLNDALTLFEEGIKVLKETSKVLIGAEQKAKILIEEAEGVISVQEFDA